MDKGFRSKARNKLLSSEEPLKSPAEMVLTIVTQKYNVYTSRVAKKQHYNSVQPPFLLVGGGGVWEGGCFQKGVAGKKGSNFFRGRCNFYKKKKVKSELFNSKKKVYKQK